MAEQGICIYTKIFQIQVESLKYDVQEKTDLLQEAGLALEQLENKISRMTIEREEEKSRLETRLQQMEDDLNDSQIKLFDEEEQVKLRGGQSRASSSPIASSGPDANKDEDDEKLLREVEAEMSRRLPYDQSARPAPPALMLPLSGSNSCDSLMAPMRPTHLAVVEERAAAEAEVEELGQALRLSEECLEEVRGVDDWHEQLNGQLYICTIKRKSEKSTSFDRHRRDTRCNNV